MLILAKQGWILVRRSREVYEHWKRLPDADRERTRASAERVGGLSAELSKALSFGAVGRVRGNPMGAERVPEVIAAELRLALTEIATGPLGDLALDTMGPKTLTGRSLKKVGEIVAKRVAKNAVLALAAGLQAERDPSAARLAALLDVLRAQQRQNNRTRVGLTNLPKHRNAKTELVSIGERAVPQLIAVLDAPRPSTDTPEGDIEDGVANDIAEVLGAIGDPRAIDVLVAQFDRYIVAAPPALARFPEGVEALLGSLDAPEEFVRGCCVRGLASATVERARAASGITKALGDEEAHNREQAALAAMRLALPDSELLLALDQVAVGDPSERVRAKAQQAQLAFRDPSGRT